MVVADYRTITDQTVDIFALLDNVIHLDAAFFSVMDMPYTL